MSQFTPREGVIRRVLVPERQDFLDHLKRLSPQARRSRFSGGVSDLFLAEYAEQAFRGDTVIFGWFLDGQIRAAAELRRLDPPWRGKAEAAVSVEEPWQDSGVGTTLLGRVMLAARNRGLTQLVVVCLPENAAMQRIARKHGARLIWEEGDVVGRLNPPIPTPWSVWREILDESEGFLSRQFESPVGQPAE